MPATARPRLAILASILAATLAASCGGAGSRGLALTDPVLELLSPGAEAAYRRAAGSLVTLESENLSARLYEAIDREDPAWVLLSPLLASEIRGILDSSPGIRVGWAGPAEPPPDERLALSVFDRLDAAALAAGLLAAEARRLSGTGPAPLSAAVFAGEGAAARAEAFLDAWKAAGGPGEPVMREAQGGFSPAIASELRLLDIRAAYVSSDSGETERWLAECFDQGAFLAAETPLPSADPASKAAVMVCWDLESTLESLVGRLGRGVAGRENGVWMALQAAGRGR